MELTNEHVGVEFYSVSISEGIILTNTIMKVTEDSVVVTIGGEQFNMSKKHYNPDFKTKEECEQLLSNEIDRINNSMGSISSSIKYVYEKVLLPTSELSYHDIIENSLLSRLELEIFKKNCKDFFGLEL